MNNRPHNVFKGFTEQHIQEVYDVLFDYFGFPEKVWKAKFRDYLSRESRGTTVDDAFLKFGSTIINPVLNGVLGRSPLHPTFNKLIAYILSGKHKKKINPARPAQGIRKA